MSTPISTRADGEPFNTGSPSPGEPLWASLTPRDTEAASKRVEQLLAVLVQDVLAGDKAAINKFHDLFYPLLCSLSARNALSLSRRRHDSSFSETDLTQWSWLYIVNGCRPTSAGSFNTNPSPLAKWLSNPVAPLRAFVAVMVGQYLRGMPRLLTRGGGPATVPIDGLMETASLAVQTDYHIALRYKECWEKLSEENRAIADLVFIDGVSQEQVARAYGLSSPSLSRRITALKKAFVECLDSSFLNIR